ncbi:MAG: hypothetical protein LKE39_07480 [Sphaerochaeta sp.]|nr:hypothetical protein [Sphaerochaeta sp.]MCH3920294.1 hypothetical protein [Sphaerochaeta sp.]MCI2097204.1 hypothetical protein [Sphaerochaeta sp.]
MCDCVHCTVRRHGGRCAWHDKLTRQCLLRRIRLGQTRKTVVFPLPKQPGSPPDADVCFDEVVKLLVVTHPRLCEPAGMPFFA